MRARYKSSVVVTLVWDTDIHIDKRTAIQQDHAKVGSNPGLVKGLQKTLNFRILFQKKYFFIVLINETFSPWLFCRDLDNVRFVS